MNRTTIDRALLWKEVRQVAPLVWTVLLLGLALCLLFVLAEMASSKGGKTAVPPIPFLAIPILFATGVGILLVGNEKDQRTLTWLRSLPIPPGRIASIKFLVAVGSLGFVWLASILLWWILRSSVGPGVAETNWNGVGEYASLGLIYPMVSLFLTFSGLAMAWRTSSSVVALLSLVPMSIALWLVAALIARVANHYQWDLGGQADWDLGGGSPWIYLMVIAAGTVAAFAYGWRASLLHLRPQDGPRQTVFRLGASIADSAAVDSSSLLWPSQPRTSALLWQSAYQSRWIWTGLAAILAFTVWLTVQIPFDSAGRGAPASDYIDPVVQIGFVLLLLAVCWLGVFAYQSDNMNERIRFLSDRGVSPSRVWWTRHWIPVLILIGAALIRYVLRPYHSYDWEQLPQVVIYDFFRLLGIGIAIYAASQWIGQSLRSPIIAAVVAPLGVLALFIYGVFAHAMFEAPYWLVGSASFLLLVATWFQTKPWMDRAFGWKYYFIHGGFLLAAMILPLLPGIWKLASIPRMPNDIRESLSNLARQPRDAKFIWSYSRPDFHSPSQMFMVPTVFASNKDARKQLLEDLKSTTIQVHDWDSLRRNLDFYLSALIASRHAMEMEATPENQTNYRKTIEGLLALVETWRDNGLLLWQDGSEVIEIALLGECRNEATRQAMGEPLYRSVAQLLSDNANRDACRRQALASAWESGHSSQTLLASQFQSRLGDYYFAQNGNGSFVSQAQIRNFPEVVATRLWRLLQKEAGSAERERREIAQSLQQDSLQSDIVGPLVYIGRMGYLPGAHWRGAWEREAKALPPFNSTSNSTNTVGGPSQ